MAGVWAIKERMHAVVMGPMMVVLHHALVPLEAFPSPQEAAIIKHVLTGGI